MSAWGRPSRARSRAGGRPLARRHPSEAPRGRRSGAPSDRWRARPHRRSGRHGGGRGERGRAVRGAGPRCWASPPGRPRPRSVSGRLPPRSRRSRPVRRDARRRRAGGGWLRGDAAPALRARAGERPVVRCEAPSVETRSTEKAMLQARTGWGSAPATEAPSRLKPRPGCGRGRPPSPGSRPSTRCGFGRGPGPSGQAGAGVIWRAEPSSSWGASSSATPSACRVRRWSCGASCLARAAPSPTRPP